MSFLLLLIGISAQIHTISEWYAERNSDRRAELQWAICANLGNEWIDTVILVISCPSLKDDFLSDFDCHYECSKLHWKLLAKIRDRLTISEALTFDYKGVLIVHNLDICFTSSLRFLERDPRLTAFSCLFLSRKEFPSTRDNLLPTQCDKNWYQGSHDALVVRLPFPQAHLKRLAFPLGQVGMEARVIWELQAMGYQVLNPCHRYPIWHVHQGHARNWAHGQANLNGKSATAPPEE